MDRATELIVERIARIFEADGVSRIAGRIVAYLLVSPEARSLDELAEALHASKASVSTNARLLEWRGVLERVTRPGDRHDYYAIAEDLHQRSRLRVIECMRELRDVMEVALLSPPAADPVVRRRLESLAEFFGDMLDAFTAVEVRWRERNHVEELARRTSGSRDG